MGESVDGMEMDTLSLNSEQRQAQEDRVTTNRPRCCCSAKMTTTTTTTACALLLPLPLLANAVRDLSCHRRRHYPPLGLSTPVHRLLLLLLLLLPPLPPPLQLAIRREEVRLQSLHRPQRLQTHRYSEARQGRSCTLPSWTTTTMTIAATTAPLAAETEVVAAAAAAGDTSPRALQWLPPGVRKRPR
jgi:hypothetical protein